MNKLTDPLKAMADLEPTVLSRLAQDGYERHRHDDLALMAVEGHQPGSARVRRMHTTMSASRTRLPMLAGGVVAVGAAAAVAVALALPASHPSRPSLATGRAAAGLTARGFLLTSAVTAARAPAASGTYWYVKERDYEPSWATLGGGHTKGPASKAGESSSFGASFASTEESWTGQARSRTIVNEDLVFTFASASDKARWEAAGKPPLSTEAGSGTEPVTSNYTMTSHWGVGRALLSLAQVQRLPTTANALDKALRKLWSEEPDKAGAVGLPDPTFGQYLVQWAASLLPGPARPGTKAAIYQLLAGQPGLSLVKGVIDPAGRAGIAVGDGGGDYLVIQQGTGTLLAYVAQPVRANSVIKGDGAEVYETTGWTNQLGVAP
jgi:hypothetical protein